MCVSESKARRLHAVVTDLKRLADYNHLPIRHDQRADGINYGIVDINYRNCIKAYFGSSARSVSVPRARISPL